MSKRPGSRRTELEATSARLRAKGRAIEQPLRTCRQDGCTAGSAAGPCAARRSKKTPRVAPGCSGASIGGCSVTRTRGWSPALGEEGARGARGGGVRGWGAWVARRGVCMRGRRAYATAAERAAVVTLQACMWTSGSLSLPKCWPVAAHASMCARAGARTCVRSRTHPYDTRARAHTHTYTHTHTDTHTQYTHTQPNEERRRTPTSVQPCRTLTAGCTSEAPCSPAAAPHQLLLVRRRLLLLVRVLLRVLLLLPGRRDARKLLQGAVGRDRHLLRASKEHGPVV